MAVAVSWLRRLTDRDLGFALQYHADQDLDELRGFWGQVLRFDGAIIRMQRKSNSNQPTGRTWRSEHGVLSVSVQDTYLRSRLQAWIDQMKEEWSLDCAGLHGV